MGVIFKLVDFEGPLDLLLHLVKETKLEIKNVPLASVTAQFLAYMDELDTVDFTVAGEFIEMSATLMEIKARNILPKPKKDDADPQDIENKLKQQLEEYKILKDASEQLKQKENVDRFYKPPTELKPEYSYRLDNLTIDALTQAFSRIMHKLGQKSASIVNRQIRLDRFTVKDMMSSIRTKLTSSKRVMFFDLFEADYSKSEMINTFLALLELLKTGEVRALQENLFSDIIIEGVKTNE